MQLIAIVRNNLDHMSRVVRNGEHPSKSPSPPSSNVECFDVLLSTVSDTNFHRHTSFLTNFSPLFTDFYSALLGVSDYSIEAPAF